MRITTLFFRSVLFGLLMMLFSLNVKGAYSGTGTFTKITSLSDLTDGYYVIAFGTTYAMSNSYVSSTYLDRLAISPTGGNTITNPDETIVWRITTDGTKKTIYSEDTDKYISYTGSSNNVQVVSAVSSDNQRWTFNYVSNLFTITNAALTTRLLQYNNNSGSYRFVCYTGSQQNLTLYKLQTPTINVSSSLSNFTYKHENGPSVIQSFTVSGSSLEANVIVSSQTNSNYEISETGGDGFSAASSITITPASGSVSNKSVYVRLKAGLQVGTYNNEVIDITCSGVDAKTVTCSGSVSDCDDPDLAFSSNLPTTKTDKDASFEAIASSNNTNGTIVYSSSNESVATVNSSTGEIDLLSVGDVTITATLAASNGYCSDLDTYSFTVIQSTKTDQIITFNPLASVTYGGNSFNLTATASSGLTVTYESSDLTVATVLGNTVTIVGAGETTITARQEGNDTYNSATEIDRILTVDPKELSIPDAVVTPKTYNDSTAAIITGTLTGIVNSDDVDFVGTGIFDSENAGVNIPVTANCTLTGNDTGNYFLTQPTGLTGTINKATQTLTFNAMSLKYVGDSDFDPGATASSGLTVTYQSSNPAVATIVSGMVHIVGEGMSVITASQEGNGNYEAAADEQHTLTVKVAPTEIAVWNFNGVANAGVATWPGIFSEGLNTTSETNNITRGDDAPVSTGTNSFRTQGFKNDGISISNTDYFQVTIQPVSGYKVSLARIDANFAGTATFYANS